jgi:fibronectin-binding autotransporter adhesin
VNGSLKNSAVTVSGGGILNGTGTVGNVAAQSGGIIAPGNSIGTLNVNGNITFGAGSIYQVQTDASGASDSIVASGVASINGGTVQVQPATGTYSANTAYTILSAAGGINGNFAGASSNLLFLTPTLTYGPTSVVLTLAQATATQGVTFPSVAQTKNQVASATALQAGGAAGGTLFSVVLNSTSAANARAAFDAASGEIHATLLADEAQAADQSRRVLLEHMRGAPQGEGWSLWGQVSGDWGRIHGDGNASAASHSSAGLTVGADKALGDHWRAGVDGGYGSSTLSVPGRASAANIHGGHVGAYAFGDYGPILLRAGGDYGFGTAKTLRSIAFTGFADTAQSSQDTRSSQIFAEAGYDVALEKLTIEPFVGVNWTQLQAGAFKETGGSAALASTAKDLDSDSVNLGASFTPQPLSLYGMALAPQLRASWQHAFSLHIPSRQLSFVSTGQAFTVLGTPLDADRALVDAGLSLQATSNVQFSAGYFGAYGARASDHTVKLTADLAL